MSSSKRLIIIAWSLSATVAVLAFFAWGNGLGWRLGGLSTYKLFPLFGLLAFSLIWAHYVMAALRRYFGLARAVLAQYFEMTSSLVLVFLLLHPGLLIWQLWRDGFGLPPGSYKTYVGESLAWLAILGSISLLAFLAFELRRLFADRKWWRYVQSASDLAALAIFYHGLRLGGELQGGWYRGLWLFYGAGLIVSLLYLHGLRLGVFKTRGQP